MTILIAGGGTGGHLFPGIALAQEVRRRHPNARIVFVGTARGIEVRAVPKAGFELRLLAVRGLRQMRPTRLLSGLLRLPWSVLQALHLLHTLRPQVAVGVGGYAAGPAMAAARLLGVRCMILEQNAVPGYTTRLLAQVVEHVVCAMPCPDLPAHKVRLLGNPVRRDLLALRALPYAPRTPLRLLVFGGSQGARAINDCILAAAPGLRRLGVQLTLQTGTADVARMQAGLQRAGMGQAQVSAFIDDMASAYRDADLVLCRAGATTLAEITVCGRPSILVPFMQAAGNHQQFNAQVLVKAGAAHCMPQPTLSAERLLALLAELQHDPEQLRTMAQRAHALGRPRAVEDIADLLLREVARV